LDDRKEPRIRVEYVYNEVECTKVMKLRSDRIKAPLSSVCEHLEPEDEDSQGSEADPEFKFGSPFKQFTAMPSIEKRCEVCRRNFGNEERHRNNAQLRITAMKESMGKKTKGYFHPQCWTRAPKNGKGQWKLLHVK